MMPISWRALVLPARTGGSADETSVAVKVLGQAFPIAWLRTTGTVVLAIVMGGCSTVFQSPSMPIESAATRCGQLYAGLDAAVEKAGVGDGGAARIDGFRYLRANRFLASYRDWPMNRAREIMWIDLLRDLDIEARAFELANLPAHTRASLDLGLLDTTDPADALRRCADELIKKELPDADSVAVLRAAVEVPDEYKDWQRVLGLYPLTAIPFLHGVAGVHAESRAAFATPLDDLAIKGRLVRYEPPSVTSAMEFVPAEILARARKNALQIPLPTAGQLSQLFAAFAPVLEIDVVDRNDRIGTPMRVDSGLPDVDLSNPVVFVRAAQTRYADKVFLQLVYSFWFPARPSTGFFDLLAGRLDGITWRVTLDDHGEPLLYDSIHNCGCYHMFFPTAKLRAREVGQTLEEPILLGAMLPEPGPGERVVLRISSRTHQIQNVRQAAAVTTTAEAEAYTFVSDNYLRSLEAADGWRYSLFRPDGIVHGSERGERWLFWPMGVPDPGAMRQWGRHATAFVGRRHFDDVDLVERYFALVTAAGEAGDFR